MLSEENQIILLNLNLLCMGKDDDIIESMFSSLISLVGWAFKGLFNLACWLLPILFKYAWWLLTALFGLIVLLFTKKRKKGSENTTELKEG